MLPETKRLLAERYGGQTFTITLNVQQAMNLLGLGEQWKAMEQAASRMADSLASFNAAIDGLKRLWEPHPETRRLLAELYPMQE